MTKFFTLLWKKVKPSLFGPDYQRIADDINREFGVPYLEPGSVEANVEEPGTITIQIGQRKLMLGGRNLEILATGVDGDEAYSVKMIEGRRYYEVGFKKKHGAVLAEAIKNVLDREDVKTAHDDNWYRVTISEEKTNGSEEK